MSGLSISSDIKAVILIGARDFGRCPTATRLNRALWPLAGKPALQHLMDGLAAQGVRRFALCCERLARQTRQMLQIPTDWQVQFLEETMPRGTAGCLKDAADPAADKILLVFNACALRAPDLRQCLARQAHSKSPMTAFFQYADTAAQMAARDAQFYICDASVLSHIPSAGYFDIKEGLAPALLAKGVPIQAACWPEGCGVFRTWDEFLLAAQDFLNRLQNGGQPLDGYRLLEGRPNVWANQQPQIARNVYLKGPILMGENVTIEDGAAIIGPTILENGVKIGKNACIEQSVLWPNAVVGAGCQLRRTLVDEGQVVFARADLSYRLIAKQPTLWRSFCQSAQLIFGKKVFDRAALTFSDFFTASRRPRMILIMLILSFLALVAAYWNPTIKDLISVWLESDEYSSGMLVPALAGYAFWHRRSRFAECAIKPDFSGLFLLLFAQMLRLAGQYFMFASLQRLAFVLSIGGLLWTFLGFGAFRKLSPIFVFLFLMLPLPNRVERWITLPLQEYATASAVFCLEVLGYQPVRQGNVIQIGQTMVAIAEACNGLRMVTAFFVISGFVVLISQRKRWEKAILLLMTLPIALICNTIRLTATSIIFTFVQSKDWEMFFHDFGGIMMMPVAIGFIVLILWLLKVLFYPPVPAEPIVVLSRNKKE